MAKKELMCEVVKALPRQDMIYSIIYDGFGGGYTREKGWTEHTNLLRILFHSTWKLGEYVKFLNGQENTRDRNEVIEFIKDNVEFDRVYKEGEYAPFLVLVNPRLKGAKNA